MSNTLTMSRSRAVAHAADDTVTCTGARRRTDASIAGQLNAEWARLCDDPAATAAVRGWARCHDALAGCAAPDDVERLVVASTSDQADRILLALVRLSHDGDTLAGRTVLQLMLGKAIRIAAARSGGDSRQNLEQTAVAALWTTIATYPVSRRATKVAANIAMETLRAVTAELAHRRAETPTSPETFAGVLPGELPQRHVPADLELLDLLTWAVDRGTITAGDATLVLDIYSPAPGQPGGAAAAARRGLSWAAARQRASRAVRKISRAIQADSMPAAA